MSISKPLSDARKAQPDTVALFVSDVHLQPSLPKTTQAFLSFLQLRATGARELYLLGDLFEYWAGDDDLGDAYHAQVVRAIRQVSDAGVSVFWLGGNRDFLVGEQFARESGLTLLREPFVTEIAGQRLALAHGDAQCIDDHAYMAFRAQVRQADWQREFLAMPLARRKAIIEGMRTGSREAQRDKSYEIMDVNDGAILALFRQTGASLLIHGHTHRPAVHEYRLERKTCTRHVLPDWDCDTTPPRGGWLVIDTEGSIRRCNFDGSEIKLES